MIVETEQKEDKGFESVGAILRRLLKRKTALEAGITARFDLQRSLQLDEAILHIDSLKQAEVCA